MNKEVNGIFEQWKQFLSWCYENNDKTTEIHRDNLERVMAYTRKSRLGGLICLKYG